MANINSFYRENPILQSTLSKMIAADKSKIEILVEGKADKSLFDGFINQDRCYVNVLDGKNNILQFIQKAEKEDLKNVLVIVDADFHHLGLQTDDFNKDFVFLTDDHDLEVMIIKSDAYNKFCRAHDIGTDCHRDFLFNKVSDIGLMRYVSEEKALKLNFKNLNFNRLFDKSDFAFKLEEFLKALIKDSRETTIKNEEDLKLFWQSINAHDFVACQLCCGHDITRFLAVYLPEKAETKDKSAVNNHKNIEKQLRMCYEYEHFRETELFTALQEWETSHNCQLLRSFG